MFIEKAGELSIELVAEEHTEELTNELISFWLSEKVIATASEAQERVKDVTTIARDSENKIVGVNSFYEDYSALLENHFLHHRSFVSKAHRKSNISVRLTTVAWEYFNRRFNKGIEKKFIGLITVVQNSNLVKHMTQAIWPYSNYVYIGSEPNGNHIRVWYFDNAKII